MQDFTTLVAYETEPQETAFINIGDLLTLYINNVSYLVFLFIQNFDYLF